LHTSSTQNKEDGTHIKITRKKTITREKITIHVIKQKRFNGEFILPATIKPT
jgi:HSP20 family molecular chaperone IbpA